MNDDEKARVYGEALMPEFLRQRALGVPLRDAVLAAMDKHALERLTPMVGAEGGVAQYPGSAVDESEAST